MLALNVGNVDRALRVAIGIVLIALAGFGVLGYWAYVGVVPLVTGLLAYCPVYRIFGIRTTWR